MMSEKKYNNFLFRGIAFLLVFLPIARAGARDWAISLAMIIGAPLVFIWLLRADNTRDHKFKRTSLDLEIFIFGIIIFLSFMFSINKYRSLHVFLALAGCIGIYYLLIDNFSSKMWRRLIGLIIVIGAGLSFYGLLQYFDYLPHFWWIPRRFLASTYVNHNHFAGYLELIIPLTIGLIVSNRSKVSIHKIALFAALISMLAAFIFSQSRGGWLCLGISLLVMFVLFLRKTDFDRKKMLLVFLLIVFVFASLAFINPKVLKRAGKMTFTEFEKESFRNRLKIWQGSVGMVASRPLVGFGIGTFAQGFLRFKPKDLERKANFAHNDYIQSAAECGVFGLGVMIWILIVLLKEGLGKNNFSPLTFGCTIGVLSFCLHGLIDFNFRIPANLFLFIVFAAFIMSGKAKDTGASDA